MIRSSSDQLERRYQIIISADQLDIPPTNQKRRYYSKASADQSEIKPPTQVTLPTNQKEDKNVLNILYPDRPRCKASGPSGSPPSQPRQIK